VTEKKRVVMKEKKRKEPKRETQQSFTQEARSSAFVCD